MDPHEPVVRARAVSISFAPRDGVIDSDSGVLGLPLVAHSSVLDDKKGLVVRMITNGGTWGK